MESTQNLRSEDDIFAELEALAAEPGYAHVIAMLCFRDNSIGFAKEMEAIDIAKMYSDERLVRTEISTLIGLLVKSNINLNIPSPDKFQQMLDRTDQLLLELHKAMMEPGLKELSNAIRNGTSSDMFTSGIVLREAIFYCGESAYDFQFRDFTAKKYSSDNDWLKDNKGFSVGDALKVVSSISTIQTKTLNRTLKDLIDKNTREWTLLPGYIFTTNQVIESTRLDPNSDKPKPKRESRTRCGLPEARETGKARGFPNGDFPSCIL
jgi:hypothetical protein